MEYLHQIQIIDVYKVEAVIKFLEFWSFLLNGILQHQQVLQLDAKDFHLYCWSARSNKINAVHLLSCFY